MRNFNMLAALAAPMLMGGGALAKEKSGEPKPRKICRSEHMPGRVTPKRICRIVTPAEVSAKGAERKTDAPGPQQNGRD